MRTVHLREGFLARWCEAAEELAEYDPRHLAEVLEVVEAAVASHKSATAKRAELRANLRG